MTMVRLAVLVLLVVVLAQLGTSKKAPAKESDKLETEESPSPDEQEIKKLKKASNEQEIKKEKKTEKAKIKVSDRLMNLERKITQLELLNKETAASSAQFQKQLTGVSTSMKNARAVTVNQRRRLRLIEMALKGISRAASVRVPNRNATIAKLSKRAKAAHAKEKIKQTSKIDKAASETDKDASTGDKVTNKVSPSPRAPKKRKRSRKVKTVRARNKAKRKSRKGKGKAVTETGQESSATETDATDDKVTDAPTTASRAPKKRKRSKKVKVARARNKSKQNSRKGKGITVSETDTGEDLDAADTTDEKNAAGRKRRSLPSTNWMMEMKTHFEGLKEKTEKGMADLKKRIQEENARTAEKMKALKAKFEGLIHKKSDDDNDYEDAGFDDGDLEFAAAGKDDEDVLAFAEEDEVEDEWKPEKKPLNERFQEFQKRTAEHFAGLRSKLKG